MANVEWSARAMRSSSLRACGTPSWLQSRYAFSVAARRRMRTRIRISNKVFLKKEDNFHAIGKNYGCLGTADLGNRRRGQGYRLPVGRKGIWFHCLSSYWLYVGQYFRTQPRSTPD